MLHAHAADLHGLARPLLPPRHARRHALADLPAGRMPRRRPRDHARRPPGNRAAVLPRAVRPGARGAHAHELLPVHRAVGRVRRHLLHLRRQGLRDVQALGLDRDGRRRLGRPATSSATSTSTRTSGRASRSASGSSGSPCSGTACPTCARSGRTTCACWGSSDEGPGLAGCASTSTSTCPLEELARQLVFTSCEVDRIVRRGVPARRQPPVLRRRQGARGRQASERRQAAADEGRRRATASRARSSAARGTSAPARPSRSSCPAASCRAASSRSRSASCAARSPTG